MNESILREGQQDLAGLRAQFPILSESVYLISNSLGAVPRQVETELISYYRTWATRGVRAWEETWWTLAADLGDELAPLIGAGRGEVVFQPTVTLAHAVVLSGLGGERRRVVTDELHFPSILYLLKEQYGENLTIVPSADGMTIDAGRVIEEIDETVGCVCLSHVLYKSSFVQDIQPIAGRAREVGAMMVVDGYQAVGSIEVDVRALGVDVYIGGCLKWLCGGPGAAFVWVDPERARALTPRVTGWMAHRRPFGFEPELDRREDAWRFLHGTPNIPALYAARPGLRMIKEVGAEAIRRHSLRLTARLIERAGEAGLVVKAAADPARRGGTVAVDVPHGYEVSRALKDRDILCDYRPGAGIRLSPHFYNTEGEGDEAVAAIVEIGRDGSWSRHAGGVSTVT